MTNHATEREVDAEDTSRIALIDTPLHLELSHIHPAEFVRVASWERSLGLPEWRTDTIPAPADPLALLPAGALVVLHQRDGEDASVAAEGPDFVVRISSSYGSTRLFVAARTAEIAEGILARARDSVEVPPTGTVPFTLWRNDGGEPTAWRRDLEVPQWADIERNYPAAADLEALMAMGSLEGTGRLMLWTGAPGTGKTFAIRALARAWSSWCAAHLVVDPERFFGDAGYLIQVMANGEPEHRSATRAGGPKARLIICEDADDFIRARDKAGAGLGRLLNVADGLLGQGLNKVVLLTSNTPVEQLDPALVRPGRLLANLEFGRFAPAQARAWLGHDTAWIPTEGLTLAELFEREGTTTRHLSRARVPDPTGAYL